MDDALVGAPSHNIIRLLRTFGLSLQLKSRKRVGGWRTPEGPLWDPKERKGLKGKERRQKMMPMTRLSSSPPFKKTTIFTLHQFPEFSILSFQMENPKWMKHL
jgi:hypothetical protein